MNSPKFDPADTAPTQLQRDFLGTLTVQRMANINALADLLGEMNADGLEIFRIIGSPEYKPLRDFLGTLTVQRMANINALADLLGEMNADGLEIFRIIGSPEYKPLREFLRTSDATTWKWLTKADEKKLQKIDEAIAFIGKEKRDAIDEVIKFMGNAQFMGRWSWVGIGIVSTVVGAIWWLSKNVTFK